MKEIHRQTRGSYGARRISTVFEVQGESCGRTKVSTLTRLAHVRVEQNKKFKATTDSKNNLAIAPNLIQRKFPAWGLVECTARISIAF